jgi:hypothetical protein
MLVVIRGAGDIASGIALRLKRAHISVVMTDIPAPTAIRRTVCFSQAILFGTCDGGGRDGPPGVRRIRGAGNSGGGGDPRAGRPGGGVHPGAAARRGGGRHPGQAEPGHGHHRRAGGGRRGPRLHRGGGLPRGGGDHAGPLPGPRDPAAAAPSPTRASPA